MTETKHSGLATASLILGILSIVFIFIPFISIAGLILAILAVIFGALTYWGKGQKDVFGLAGFILGLIAIILILITVVVAATVYVYVSGMIGPGPEMAPSMSFMADEDEGTLTLVAYYSSDVLPWSDFDINGNCDTDGLGTFVMEGDIITECSGQISITYRSTGSLVWTWTFE